MNIRRCTDNFGLISPFTDILLSDFTYYTHYASESQILRIDHIFHSVPTTGIMCSDIGTSNDSILDGFDHRSAWLGIHLPDGIRTRGAPPAHKA
jgi:hypothetical protein